MDPTPFNPETDLPPIPFDERHCQIAAALKDAGLPWRPHVGCFVWDRDELIEVGSPFPGRIYFFLNLGNFLRIFETIENITKKLVWPPTWHQARLLCDQLGVDQKELSKLWQCSGEIKAGDELFGLYEILLERLRKKAMSG
jgi:hypothetical protein